MKIDPAVVKIFAENVRADIIQRPAGLHLDAAIVKKIATKVKVLSARLDGSSEMQADLMVRNGDTEHTAPP